MSQNKSISSRITALFLTIIIALSVFAPNTALAATMPGLNAAVTEENIMAILDKYDPNGALYLRTTSNKGLPYTRWWSEGQKILDRMDDAVHEECHAYTVTNFKDGFNTATIRYHVSTGRDISVTYDSRKVYMTNEVAQFIPTSMRYQRYGTYVGAGIDESVAASQYGVYGLLDEYNAYSWGFNNSLCMYNYVKDIKGEKYAKKWLKDRGGYNIGAYAEFKYWIYMYMLHAKNEYPDLYADIANNKDFIEAYNTIDKRYTEEINRYIKLTGSYGYDYMYYIKAMKELGKSKYSDVRAVLGGAQADTQEYKWTGAMEWTSLGYIFADTDGVLLSWKRTYDSDGYKIYRRAANESYVEIKDVTENPSGAYLRHNYKDKTAEGGKLYRYYVVPYKKSGGSLVYGKPSIVRIVETLDKVNLTSAKYTDGVFKLKWTAPDSFDGFDVAQVFERGTHTITDGNSTTTTVGTSMFTYPVPDKKSRSYSFEPHFGNGNYTLKVRGYINKNGTRLYSNWSNEIKVVVE